MEIATFFSKYGPEWLLIAVLLTILFYLVRKIIQVVESNTGIIAKFTEIVSHCERKKF